MGELNLSEKLLQELKCRYCKFYLSCGPIRCNSTGDTVCGRCMPSEDTLTRAHLYEKIAKEMKFPCSYDDFGCTEMLAFNQSAEHESICFFKPITCPSLDKCNWKGLIKDVYKHYKSHKLILNKSQFEISIKDNSEVNWMMLQSNLPILVQYKYVAVEKKLYFDVAYIYDGQVNIMCKITLFNGNDDDLSTNLKPFKSHHYVSGQLNLNVCQKIFLKDYLPALQNPDVIVVKIACVFQDNLPIRSSNDVILQKLKCNRCKICVIPPIVVKNRKYYCKSCEPNGEVDLRMNEMAETLQYTCRWENCGFKTNCMEIREHEFSCLKATVKCCLGCDEYFNTVNFINHVRTKHRCTVASTVNLKKIKTNLLEAKSVARMKPVKRLVNQRPECMIDTISETCIYLSGSTCYCYSHDSNLTILIFYEKLSDWYVDRINIFTDSKELDITSFIDHNDNCYYSRAIYRNYNQNDNIIFCEGKSYPKVPNGIKIEAGKHHLNTCACRRIMLKCRYL